MVDKRKLKAAIVAAGETQGTLAKKIGLRTTSLNYRINGKLDFRASEIRDIAKVLGLSQEETFSIFFGGEVEKNSTEGIGE